MNLVTSQEISKCLMYYDMWIKKWQMIERLVGIEDVVSTTRSTTVTPLLRSDPICKSELNLGCSDTTKL